MHYMVSQTPFGLIDDVDAETMQGPRVALAKSQPPFGLIDDIDIRRTYVTLDAGFDGSQVPFG